MKVEFAGFVQDGVSVEDFPLPRLFLAVICRTIEEKGGKKHKFQMILYPLRHSQFVDSKTSRTPTTNSLVSFSCMAVSASEAQR
jgi:hypothetical protein